MMTQLQFLAFQSPFLSIKRKSKVENDEKKVIKNIKNIVGDYLIKRTAGVEDPRRFGDQLLQMDGVSLAGFSSEKVFSPTVCWF